MVKKALGHVSTAITEVSVGLGVMEQDSAPPW
jgi:hypothetical protein